MKITLIILSILGILLCLFACSVYYPTSYRAFIPKERDSEYKEYEKLCKMSKKVLFILALCHNIYKIIILSK